METVHYTTAEERLPKATVFRDGMYRDPGLEAQMENLEAPLTPEARECVESRIQCAGHDAYRHSANESARKQGAAQSNLSVEKDRMQVVTKALEEEKKRIVHVAPTALSRGISCALAFAACISAEYIVSLAILGWLLNLEGTFIHHALALISVAALTGVEFTLGMVLMPYLINEAGNLNDSRVRRGFVYSLAVVSIVGNFWMVWTMANAREIALREKSAGVQELLFDEASDNLSPTLNKQVDGDEVINRFILALALVSCFDGALFSLIAPVDFASLNARRRQQTRISGLEKVRAATHEELSRAEQATIEADRQYVGAAGEATKDEQEWTAAMMCLLQLRQDFLVRREQEQQALQAVFANDERKEARKRLRENPLSVLVPKVMRSRFDEASLEQMN